MRIAFIANPETPNGWYRAIGPLLVLGMQGHRIEQVWRGRDRFRDETIAACDVLHIHRQHDERVMRLAAWAKERGVGVIWDNDDDLLAVPRNNVAHRTLGGVGKVRVEAAIRRMATITDVMTTPSQALAAQYRALGGRDVEVIENFVPDASTLVPRPRARPDIIVIGWLAGGEHHVDAEAIPIRAALQATLDSYPQVEVQTVGVGLGLASDRYRATRRVLFDELARTVVRFDVGIAPIADTPFNRARSNVKLKEYAVVGVPWLASPIGPYADLGAGEGGKLVPDDGWVPALARMVERERERRKLAKRARRWGMQQVMSRNVDRWLAVYERAVSQAAGPARH